MALFDRDYDRDYGRRWGTTGYGARSRYDQGFRGTARYDRDYGDRTRFGAGQRPMDRTWESEVDTGAYYGRTGYGYGYGTRYDRDYGATRWGAGERYDRGYKSRVETDYGDPFGDRTSHTPMRMVDEGRARRWGAYDRDYGTRGWGASARYDRGFRDVSDEGRYRGVGYDPYAGGYGYGTRYDRGWF